MTDQLRLYRTHDAKITRCVGFTFPKQKVHQCVVMVTVTWERMGFKYTIEDSECVSDIIATELRTASSVAPSPGRSQDLRFLMPLSREDLRSFCDGANGSPAQISSGSSILVRHGMDYFKSPADLKEYSQLLEITHIALALPTIKLHPVAVGDTRFFKYRGIPYGPLTHKEAQSCLYKS